MRTKEFWLAAVERAVKTFAQTAVALVGVELVSVVDLDWGQVGGVSATAAVLSWEARLDALKAGAEPPRTGPGYIRLRRY